MSHTILPPCVAPGKNLHWLLRYAHHGEIKFNAHRDEATTLKNCFTPAAWRLLCRSGKAGFLPILRNRHLCFDSLVHYAQSLVEHGFEVAPNPEFLDYFIQSSYLFFDRMPGVPHESDEMTLLRLATRCGGVSRAQLQRVNEWLAWGLGSVTTRMTWRAVLRRANEWHLRQQLVVDHARANDIGADAKNGWHFACGALPWQGYAIIPLAHGIDLWDEGQAMSSCLYRLRNLCQRGTEPSLFFSVRKDGRRHATLELVRDEPNESLQGPERIHGRWRLQDCRLSHNRLPSEELVKILADFGLHYNILSQGPGEAPTTARPSRSVRTNKAVPGGATMTRQPTRSLSLDARQLQQRVSALVRDYEISLGPVPVWFAELDLEQALSLMAACLRIGLRLPPDETLEADMAERMQAAQGSRLRRGSRKR
ncbi:hypothetical protein [Polaromonas sp. CG9_12]|nr:hypothetical protein [Polaromonas sp. CG9_12]